MPTALRECQRIAEACCERISGKISATLKHRCVGLPDMPRLINDSQVSVATASGALIVATLGQATGAAESEGAAGIVVAGSTAGVQGNDVSESVLNANATVDTGVWAENATQAVSLAAIALEPGHGWQIKWAYLRVPETLALSTATAQSSASSVASGHMDLTVVMDMQGQVRVSGVRHDDDDEFFFRVGQGVGGAPILHVCWRGHGGWGQQRLAHRVSVSSTVAVVLWSTRVVLGEPAVESPPLNGYVVSRSTPVRHRFGDTLETFMVTGERPSR
jgi:hypothetical protein